MVVSFSTKWSDFLMEALNVKLIDKYENLKKRKISELEGLSSMENVKLRNYHTAMVELIESLKKEKDELLNKLLLKEDECAKCEKLLTEEKEKSKELSREVERLRGIFSESNRYRHEHENSATPSTYLKLPSFSAKKTRSKRSGNKNVVPDKEIVISPISSTKILQNCSARSMTHSADGNENDPCAFHILVESLVGMKFSIESRKERPHFSVIHTSSGYSFSLTWLETGIENGEWFYHVLSLGALDRLALEWMREDIMFSSAMIPLFFQKISRAIGHYQ